MMEGAIMEYVKWMIGIFGLLIIIGIVILLFRMGEINGFQQEVNYQIERHGGLTEDAYVALDNYTRDSYNGCLEVFLSEDGAYSDECLLPQSSDTKIVNGKETIVVGSSGFSVHEIKDTPTGKAWVTDRGDKQAKYGTQIDYVVKRNVGEIQGMSIVDPIKYGSSSSRVRGTADVSSDVKFGSRLLFD